MNYRNADLQLNDIRDILEEQNKTSGRAKGTIKTKQQNRNPAVKEM